MIDVEPLTPRRLEALEALFAAAACTCHCRYWHFTGTKNEWLDRSANAPEKSRDEQAALVRAEDPAGRGLLAIEGDAAIGWMKLAPRALLPKLRSLPVYRSVFGGPRAGDVPSDLGDDAGVYSVGCFLVHPDHRGRGVAHALLSAAGTHVLGWGGHTIEAYPRRSPDRLHPEELWLGPESLFLSCGFVAVHDVGPYPVLRKTLTGKSPRP